MTPTGSPRPHDWTFLTAETAAARTVIPLAIAVCRECGLVRNAVVAAEREGRIDLRGECPGR